MISQGTIRSVKRTKTGTLAILSDGSTWYLPDPYFGKPTEWQEMPRIPLPVYADDA